MSWLLPPLALASLAVFWLGGPALGLRETLHGAVYAPLFGAAAALLPPGAARRFGLAVVAAAAAAWAAKVESGALFWAYVLAGALTGALAPARVPPAVRLRLGPWLFASAVAVGLGASARAATLLTLAAALSVAAALVERWRARRRIATPPEGEEEAAGVWLATALPLWVLLIISGRTLASLPLGALAPLLVSAPLLGSKAWPAPLALAIGWAWWVSPELYTG